MSKSREIRMQPFESVYRGENDRPLVRLGDVGVWSMVRRADMPSAMPFVISRREWDRLPIQEVK